VTGVGVIGCRSCPRAAEVADVEVTGSSVNAVAFDWSAVRSEAAERLQRLTKNKRSAITGQRDYLDVYAIEPADGFGGHNITRRSVLLKASID